MGVRRFKIHPRPHRWATAPAKPEPKGSGGMGRWLACWAAAMALMIVVAVTYASLTT